MNNEDRLAEALRVCRDAIASLPEDALGTGEMPCYDEHGQGGILTYPIRDEIIDAATKALAAHEASRAEVSDAEHLRTELGRAYRALHAFAFAQRKGKFLAYTAVMYHSPTIGAAARFVRDGALDGSEYFIGKPVKVLHSALRGDEPDAARNAGGSE